jgi:hypothetical protein
MDAGSLRVARTYSYVYSTNTVTITSSIDDVIIHNYNNKSQLIGGSIKWAGQDERLYTVHYTGGLVSKVTVLSYGFDEKVKLYTYDAKNENIIKVQNGPNDPEPLTFEFQSGLNPHHIGIASNPYNVSMVLDFYLEGCFSKNVQQGVIYTYNEKNLPVSGVIKNANGEVDANYTYEYEIR